MDIANCIAHFILGIYVSRKTLKFHDFTSILLHNPPKKLKDICKLYFTKPTHPYSSYFPNLNHKFRWFLHNSIVHFFLGLFPCKFMFKLHDKSAKWMNELYWV